MQQDKAIIKALEKEEFSSLSRDFNERVMFCIYKRAERKEKQNFIFMLSCISAVSLGLIVTAIYLLKKYLLFNFSFNFQRASFKLNFLSQYYFEIYIAVLILVLIFFDYLFRILWNKKEYEKSVEL